MIVGISMVRDEADVIERLVEHMLAEGVDHLIIADNLSTDGTGDLLHDLPEVTVQLDRERGYYQADKMTALARQACDIGADWVIPFDADEIWYAPGQTIRDALDNAACDVVLAPAYDHIARLADPFMGHPFDAIVHRRDYPQKMPKVAFRASPDARLHMGNHDVDRPGEREQWLEIRHFQYRSLDQMARKVRQGTEAYEAADLHAMYGTHWKELAALSDEALEARWSDLCCEQDLIYDPAPVRRL